MERLYFRKKQRLVSNEQFKSVLNRKCCVRNQDLMLFVAENDCNYPRFGVSVSRACGNAVVRNRIKRVLRESFRQNQYKIAQSYDYFFVTVKPKGKKVDKKHKNRLFSAKIDDINEMFMKLAIAVAEKADRSKC